MRTTIFATCLAALLVLPQGFAGSAEEPELRDAIGDSTVPALDVQAVWFGSDATTVSLTIAVGMIGSSQPTDGGFTWVYTADFKDDTVTQANGNVAVKAIISGRDTSATSQGIAPQVDRYRVVAGSYCSFGVGAVQDSTATSINCRVSIDTVNNLVKIVMPKQSGPNTAFSGGEVLSNLVVKTYQGQTPVDGPGQRTLRDQTYTGANPTLSLPYTVL